MDIEIPPKRETGMDKSEREREEAAKKRRRDGEVKNSGKFQKLSFLKSNLKHIGKERFE